MTRQVLRPLLGQASPERGFGWQVSARVRASMRCGGRTVPAQCSGRIRRIELTVDETAEQQFLIDTGGHYFALLDCSPSAFAAGISSLASMARARDSRDMTVPTGTPVTSAISA
jgi:hypothetical protein